MPLITKKIIIMGALLVATIPTHAYRDVQPNSTLKPILDHYIEQGVLKGEGFFRSEDTMPAGFFWEILMKSEGLTASAAKPDLPLPLNIDINNPQAAYLQEAVRQGLIDPSQNFQTDKPMKRIEVIQALVAVHEIPVSEYASSKLRNLTTGISPLAQYLREVESAYASKILEKTDLKPLNPYANAKRKDIIRWIHNWEKNGKLKKDSLNETSKSEYQYPYQKRRSRSSKSMIQIQGLNNKVRSTSQDSLVEMKVLQEVFNQINARYRFIDELEDDKKQNLINAAIGAMVKELGDKYSSYIKPDDSAEFLSGLDGKFEGIGAYVEMILDQFTITSPIKGSPADRAGLLPGDIVTHVDEEDITGQNINQIVKKVRGTAGSKVVLRIQREAMNIGDITVTRGKITVPALTLEYKKGIPVIGLHQFKRDTGSQLRTLLLNDVLPKNPKGIVFDLRNNAGGFLTAAQQVGEIFLKQGDLIFEVEYSGSKIQYKAKRNGELHDFPNMVFLQNKGTASASEILHGMVKDRQLGKIIGTNSVGKGTVQEVMDFANGSTLKLTIAKWLTPNGRWIHEVGVLPDLEITSPTGEEKQKNIDRQLDAALQEIFRGY